MPVGSQGNTFILKILFSSHLNIMILEVLVRCSMWLSCLHLKICRRGLYLTPLCMFAFSVSWSSRTWVLYSLWLPHKIGFLIVYIRNGSLWKPKVWKVSWPRYLQLLLHWKLMLINMSLESHVLPTALQKKNKRRKKCSLNHAQTWMELGSHNSLG